MKAEQRSARDEAKLRQRAERLARQAHQGALRRPDVSVAVLAVGGERLGIPVDGLREIVKAPPIAPLPGLPSWIAGIVQIRGELISVAHLGRMFEIETDANPAFLAIVEHQGRPVGLLADDLLGLREIFGDEIAEKFEETAGDSSRPVRATTRDLLAILDLQRLVEDERLVVDHAGHVGATRD
jgi:purine-binding chemotaxis protein CheW